MIGPFEPFAFISAVGAGAVTVTAQVSVRLPLVRVTVLAPAVE